jgi:hypothetical protein
MKAQRGVEVLHYSFLTSAQDVGEWSKCHAPAALPLGRDPVPVIQEAGWTTGPVWTSAENLATIRTRFPDRAVRSESLYRLQCPALRRVALIAIWRFRTFCGWWWSFLLAQHSGRLLWRHAGPRVPPLKLRDLSNLSNWYAQTGTVLQGVTFRL